MEWNKTHSSRGGQTNYPIRMRHPGYRPYISYLKDIAQAMEKIIIFSESLSYFKYQTICPERDAILYNFQIMGEAVKKLPRNFQSKNKHIPWNAMSDLRNDIVHEYFDPDDEIVWEIIQHDLPKNIADIKRLLEHVDK
jgi:uncharacterized protein with HEPN domain